MNSNANDSDIKQWKKRCLQLEQQQENIQTDGELLCKVLQRLGALVQGVDKELDAQLDDLQDSAKAFPPNSHFSSKAHRFENTVLQMLQRRDDGVSFSKESLSQLLTHLADAVENQQVNSRYEQLKEDVSRSVEQYYEYPRLLNELVRFQAQVLDLMQSAEAVSDDDHSGSLDAVHETCRHVGKMLLKLLETLNIPKSLLTKARGLRERVESEFGWDDIEPLLQDILELAVNATASDHQEFENYLQSLNVQLDDIQSFLSDSRQDQLDSQESSRKLDEAVRGDVAKMEDSLVTSTSLEQLKDSVRHQLTGIVDAVDSYRKDQQQREVAAESRLQHLQEQIEVMEKKASEVQEHLEEQRLRAMSDPLTGLPNRAAFDECIDSERRRAKASGQPLTLVICDLDHFKRVNDNYGHLAGDKVLRLVSKILRGGLRPADFICRYGGEEFVIVLPETTADQAKAVMEKLRRVMEQSPFNFKGQPVQVTMSFGIAENRSDEETDDFFNRTDKSLYRAKEQGRNRCVIAD